MRPSSCARKPDEPKARGIPGLSAGCAFLMLPLPSPDLASPTWDVADVAADPLAPPLGTISRPRPAPAAPACSYPLPPPAHLLSTICPSQYAPILRQPSCPRALRARSLGGGRTESHDRTLPLGKASRLTNPCRRRVCRSENRRMACHPGGRPGWPREPDGERSGGGKSCAAKYQRNPRAAGFLAFSAHVGADEPGQRVGFATLLARRDELQAALTSDRYSSTRSSRWISSSRP